MNSESFNEADRLIQRSPLLQDFVGPRSDSLIQAAENVLGLKFPDTYRCFLLKYGAGSFGGTEIYGVVQLNSEESAIPDMVWLTLRLRRAGRLPNHMIPVYNGGLGDLFCLDCSKYVLNEAPVVTFQPGYPIGEQRCEFIAHDFGEFFLRIVKSEISYQRSEESDSC